MTKWEEIGGRRTEWRKKEGVGGKMTHCEEVGGRRTEWEEGESGARMRE